MFFLLSYVRQLRDSRLPRRRPFAAGPTPTSFATESAIQLRQLMNGGNC